MNSKITRLPFFVASRQRCNSSQRNQHRDFADEQPEKTAWKVGKRGSVVVYAFPVIQEVGKPSKLVYYTHPSLHSFSDDSRDIPDSLWHKLTVKYPTKLADGWEREFGQAKQDSWKHKLYKLGVSWTTENARIPYSETFLKSLELDPPPPRMPIEHVQVRIHSTFAHPDLAKRLSDAATARVAHHKTRFYLSVALLPISSLAGILPGPNVFLLYNGWRAWSHWKCLENVRALQTLIVSDSLEYVSDARLEPLIPSESLGLNPNQQTAQETCDEGDSVEGDSGKCGIAGAENGVKVMSEESIHQASHILGLDASLIHHLHKAKTQLLASK